MLFAQNSRKSSELQQPRKCNLKFAPMSMKSRSIVSDSIELD